MPLDLRSARLADLNILESAGPDPVGCMATRPQFSCSVSFGNCSATQLFPFFGLLLYEKREPYLSKAVLDATGRTLSSLAPFLLKSPLVSVLYTLFTLRNFTCPPTDDWRLSSIFRTRGATLSELARFASV